METTMVQAFIDWEFSCLRLPVESLDYFSLFGQGCERMLLAMRQCQKRVPEGLSQEASEWFEDNLKATRDALTSSLKREAAQVYFSAVQWLEEERSAQGILDEARAEPVEDWQKEYRVLYWQRAVDLAQLGQRFAFERLVTGDEAGAPSM